MKHINLDAAGVDIGADKIDICVPVDRDAQPVRAGRLAGRVQAVAMESTGWV